MSNINLNVFYTPALNFENIDKLSNNTYQ